MFYRSDIMRRFCSEFCCNLVDCRDGQSYGKGSTTDNKTNCVFYDCPVDKTVHTYIFELLVGV